MKVFISWSGSESKQIAHALRAWLPEMFELVTPYMSDEDNGAGVRWSKVIADELDSSSFGILCCTPSNLKAPWLNFEAGALSKTVATARVVPLLHNLSPSDIGSPFSEFMAERDDEEGVWKTVKAINDCLTTQRDEPRLRRAFERTWPDLQAKLTAVVPAEQEPASAPVRPDRELLEEILELLREKARATLSDISSIELLRGPIVSPHKQETDRRHLALRTATLARLDKALRQLRAGLTFDASPNNRTLYLIVPMSAAVREQAVARSLVRAAAAELGWEYNVLLVDDSYDPDPGPAEETP